jgi:hypothetical protein
MYFCDFCGRGFEESKNFLKERENLGESGDLFVCEECAEYLKRLDAADVSAVDYFMRHIVNGVTLKSAYLRLAKSREFKLAEISCFARMKPIPSQRQDGKTGIRLSFARQKNANPDMLMPPIIIETGLASGEAGIAFGKPFYDKK